MYSSTLLTVSAEGKVPMSVLRYRNINRMVWPLVLRVDGCRYAGMALGPWVILQINPRWVFALRRATVDPSRG